METPNRPRILLKSRDSNVSWTSQPQQSLPPIRTPIKLKPKSRPLGFSEIGRAHV